MRANQLIKLLEEAVKDNGNLPVRLYDRRGEHISKPAIEGGSLMKSTAKRCTHYLHFGTAGKSL